MAVKSELSEQKLGYIRELVNNKDPKEEYKLIQSIGTGTYGEALRLKTKELAAVKIIKIDAKDDVRAILQEIQTLRDCRHNNIVQFFGSYFRNNKLWICMEFCGGFSMQDIYTNIRRPIEENCIAFVTRETLRGIEYMHKAGKIHRDIKGANILLTNDGDVKIVDENWPIVDSDLIFFQKHIRVLFSVALPLHTFWVDTLSYAVVDDPMSSSLLADFGVAAQITQTIQRRNSFIGTPYWMAPEVAAVERKGGYDEKCDIWALGITAMEYAELQPPLFDLHPMRALRILGMRSYKPPTLRNKTGWSSKFHSFLKAALTKSEKKRPTAQALLRHELVTQPHLTRALTLRLLELNRNPDRLSTVATSAPSAAVPSTPHPLSSNPSITNVVAQSPPGTPRASALLAGRPDVLSIAKFAGDTMSTASEDNKRNSADRNDTSKIPRVSSANERPKPPEKMHTPWSQRITSNDATPMSSATTTPVASPEPMNDPKQRVPAERIAPARQHVSSDHTNGYSHAYQTSASPADSNAQRSLLEGVRIMDELPTPLPAYVSVAPTASPAVKPSEECIQLLACGKHIKTTAAFPHNVTSEPSHSISRPVEALVKQSHVATSLTTPICIAASDSSAIASSESVSTCSSSSSCSSASTSPRSSCSSFMMESVQQAEMSHICSQRNLMNGQLPEAFSNSTHSRSVADNSLISETAQPALHEQFNGRSERLSTSMTQSFPSSSVSDSRPDHLSVYEPVILQDSLEAQFIPIDAEALVLGPQQLRNSAAKHAYTEKQHISITQITTTSRASLRPTNENSPIPLETRESYSSSDADEEVENVSDVDDSYSDSDKQDESLSDAADRLSYMTHGTVTTIESDSSSVVNVSVPGETSLAVVGAGSESKVPSRPIETDTKMCAPVAFVENPDDWDLGVADDELLAADGLLRMNRSHPDSLSDRISEFGFRIHGSSDGEDEEEPEEDDYLEDEQNELVIPNVSLDLTSHLLKDASNVTSIGPHVIVPVTHSDDSGHHTDVAPGIADERKSAVLPGLPNGTREKPDNVATHTSPSMMHSPDVSFCEAESLQAFYPDKSGEFCPFDVLHYCVPSTFQGVNVSSTTVEICAKIRLVIWALVCESYWLYPVSSSSKRITVQSNPTETSASKPEDFRTLLFLNDKPICSSLFTLYRSSTIPPSTLAALSVVQSTKLSLNGTSNGAQPALPIFRAPSSPPAVLVSLDRVAKSELAETRSPTLNQHSSFTQPIIDKPKKENEPDQGSDVMVESQSIPLTRMKVTKIANESQDTSDSGLPTQALLFPVELGETFPLDAASPIDADPTPMVLATFTVHPESMELARASINQSGESGVLLHSFPPQQSIIQDVAVVKPVATERMSEIMHMDLEQSVVSEDESQASLSALKSTSPLGQSSPCKRTWSIKEVFPQSSNTDSLQHPSQPQFKRRLNLQPTSGSLQCLPMRSDHSAQPWTSSPEAACTLGLLSPQPLRRPHAESEVFRKEMHRRNSLTQTAWPNKMDDTNKLNRSNALVPSGKLWETTQPSGLNNSRLSMVELTHVGEQRPLHANCTGLPPTPHVKMGACFSLVFEGCPLKINSTATWINPTNNGQMLLFGTNDGIYYLNLKDLADSSLELVCSSLYRRHELFPRRCLWLSVVRDTMMSLSGRHPQLYSHNLISLMKLKSQGHAMSGNPSKLSKLTKLFPKRFSPSKKIPDTKGCRRVSVTRSPFNGAKYLCAAIGQEILVMEWFNPISSFIEIKRMCVSDMPSPLLTFDLLIIKDRPLPLVCLGVYRHHSKRGRDRQRFRLQLVDLNGSNPSTSPTSAALGSSTHKSRLSLGSPQPEKSIPVITSTQLIDETPSTGNEDSRKLEQLSECKRRNAVFLPEDVLPVVEVVQLEHNTVLICLQDCVKVISLNGRIKSSRYRAATLDFDGVIAESIVCLRDSILVFHPHGLLGKCFTGELTQEIHDEKHIYRLIGCDRNIVVESRPTDDPMSNSNIYLLAGHTDGHMQ
ncbi:uncharacterized protein DEA37_0011963 [Paragonimus westermani]|uniref:non-specific serine/threonine protein kinase n=1 Tax=Paragonimus westermani TaxID=34504 RepID=A0A5J4P275_9TREM|nr:uncharacterized protein DEA37_0011963 [Paragonimus westermani]